MYMPLAAHIPPKVRNAAYKRSVKQGDRHVFSDGTIYQGRNPVYVVTPLGVTKVQPGVPFVRTTRK